VVDVFCAAELAPTDAPVRSLTGLQLTATIAAGTREMRLVFGGAESVLVLTDDEVAHFRTFLQVTVVERLLALIRENDAELHQLDDPFGRLRDFDSFLTVCAGGHAQTDAHTPLKMALAPDTSSEQPRRLAAVFTAQDALQLFVVSRESARASDDLVSVRLTGRELFSQVADNAELDGVVFNPSGPAEPVALARDVAAAVLDGGS